MSPDPGRARSTITQAIEQAGVVAIIRLPDPVHVRPVIDALIAGGVRVLEVTMTVPGAIELIAEAARSLPNGFLIGAGTVLDVDTARRSIEAGASFVVGPVLQPDIIEECHRHDRPALPGCFSPTEIYGAWNAGADIVKVFPATSLGPTFFRDLRGPLPEVKMMPTGGVSIDNVGDWLRAGAVAVGAGSALVDPRLVAAGDFRAVTERAARLVANVRAARQRS